MGAFRAVECRPLGMVLHGWVAHQYLNGTTESDADVALLMDPVSFKPLTIPLINVRWLVQVLENERELNPPDAEAALDIAGRIRYQERTLHTLRETYRRELPATSFQVLADHLTPTAIPGWDRKRLDGMEAVAAELRSMARVPFPP